MLKKFVLGIAALGATSVALPAAAEAQYYGGYRDYRYTRDHDGYRDYRYARNHDRYRSGYHDRGYRSDPYYSNAYYDRGYRGQSYGYDRRYRCGSGTSGAIVGGAAGALLGREIARGGRNFYGNRRGGSGTVGAIIGGATGALVGREIDRSSC